MTTAPGMRAACSASALLVALAAGCSSQVRNLAAAPKGKDGCALLSRWAEEKAGSSPQQEGESSAQDDASEAIACWRRQKDDSQARAAVLASLLPEVQSKARLPLTERTGGFDDALARKLAAIALSASAAGDKGVFESAQRALQQVHGRALDLERGDRRAVGGAGEALSMIDGECFFCARPEAYGAHEGEHVEQLGRWAGISYVRRDDGREQFLIATKLVGAGERLPQQLFAEAMRRRSRRIRSSTPAQLAKRTPAHGEESADDAPLFQLALRGFAFGDVQRAEEEAPADSGPPGLRLVVRSEAGEVVVRFPIKLLERAGRERRFVAPPDGVDAVVRYEGKDGDKPRYRAVILRHEDGVAEGP